MSSTQYRMKTDLSPELIDFHRIWLTNTALSVTGTPHNIKCSNLDQIRFLVTEMQKYCPGVVVAKQAGRHLREYHSSVSQVRWWADRGRVDITIGGTGNLSKPFEDFYEVVESPYHRRTHTNEFKRWLTGTGTIEIRCHSEQQVEYLIECLSVNGLQYRSPPVSDVIKYFKPDSTAVIDWQITSDNGYQLVFRPAVGSKIVDFNDLFEYDFFVKRGYDMYGETIAAVHAGWPSESYNGEQIEHVISVPLETNPIISSQKIEAHVITTEAPGWGRSERITTVQCGGSTVAITSGQVSNQAIPVPRKK